MPGIAHLDTTALDTAAKFFRTMQKVGADFTAPMQSVAKRRNLVEYLSLGCPKITENGEINTTPTEQDLARLILGDDFITPEEVAQARNLVYNDEQLVALEENFPSVEAIAWCRGNGYMLVPAPPKTLSLLGIRDLNRTLFISQEGGWYADHPFSREDQTPIATWMGIRKDLVPNSTNKKWKEQTTILSESEVVPNAAEFAWGFTTYREVRGTWPMTSGLWARVSSVYSGGYRVILKVNGGQLYVDDCWADSRHDRIGVSASRKF